MGALLRVRVPASVDRDEPRLPVWSHDGTRIAYLDDAASAAALAWLVVVDPQGRPLARLPVKPLVSGEVRGGMRFVESIEWLDNERVVASGAINPSSTESLVFDLKRAAVVAEYVDDAHGASFSPDGKHVLLVEGAPHFTAAARAPVLSLDGKVVLRNLHAALEAWGRHAALAVLDGRGPACSAHGGGRAAGSGPGGNGGAHRTGAGGPSTTSS